MVVIFESEIARAIYGVFVFGLLLQISSTENTDKPSSTLQTNETTIVFTNSMRDEDSPYAHLYFCSELPWKISISAKSCTNKTFSDIESCIHMLEENPSFMKANNTSNFKLIVDPRMYKKIDSRLKRWCQLKPPLDVDRLVLAQSIIQELQSWQDYGILPIVSRQFSYMENANDTVDTMDKLWRESLPWSRNSIVRSFISGDLSSADQQLQLVTKHDERIVYRDFVEEIYLYRSSENNEASSFFKLLNFAHFVPNVERKLKLYEAIYETIKSHGDVNILNLLALNYGIMAEVGIVRGSTKPNGRHLIMKMWGQNQEETVTLMSASLLNDGQWPIAEETMYNMFMGSLDIYYGLIRIVIDKYLYKEDFRSLLAKIDRNVEDIRQRIIYYDSIIDKLQLDKKLNDDYLVPIVQRMKMIWDDPELNSIDFETERENLKNATDKLPTSLQNVIKFSPICVKNTYTGEYLYASEPVCKYINGSDRKYHEISTRIPRDEHMTAEFKWTIRFCSDNENFIALDNAKYDGNLDIHNSFCRPTNKCSVILYSNTTEHRSCNWRLRVNEKGVQLDLANLGYYLLVDDNKQDDGRRQVFKSISLAANNTEYPTTWEFVDCSSKERSNWGSWGGKFPV